MVDGPINGGRPAPPPFPSPSNNSLLLPTPFIVDLAHPFVLSYLCVIGPWLSLPARGQTTNLSEVAVQNSHASGRPNGQPALFERQTRKMKRSPVLTDATLARTVLATLPSLLLPAPRRTVFSCPLEGPRKGLGVFISWW